MDRENAQKDKGAGMKWHPNQAGDLECVTRLCRYRIEESVYGIWLIRKPGDPQQFTPYSEPVGRFNSVDEAIRWVSQNATPAASPLK